MQYSFPSDLTTRLSGLFFKIKKEQFIGHCSKSKNIGVLPYATHEANKCNPVVGAEPAPPLEPHALLTVNDHAMTRVLRGAPIREQQIEPAEVCRDFFGMFVDEFPVLLAHVRLQLHASLAYGVAVEECLLT